VKKIVIFGALAMVLLILTSCAPSQTTKQEAFPKMYSDRPSVILVLPPINQTTAADAKDYYSTTIAEPLSYVGYYILPIEVTNDILKSEGIYDTELISNVPLQKFKDFFGADAVMFCIHFQVGYIVLCYWRACDGCCNAYPQINDDRG